MEEKRIFMVCDDDFSLILPASILLPEMNLEETLPELYVLVETMEELLGLRVLLVVDPEVEQMFCEELIVGTTVEIEDIDDPYSEKYETFSYVSCLAGTYFFAFYEEKDGILVKTVPAPELTKDLIHQLFLARAQTLYQGEYIYVKNIINPDLHFPPLKPEAYLIGSPAWEYAKAFWDTQDEIDELEGNDYTEETAILDVSELDEEEMEDLTGMIMAVASEEMSAEDFLEETGLDAELASVTGFMAQEYVIRPPA